MHDSAVASVQPAFAAQLEHELLRSAARPRRRAYRLERRHGAAHERLRPLLRAGLDHQVDVDLEVAGADRRLDAVTVAARLGERASRPPTRSRRRSRSTRRAGGCARARTRRTGSASSARGQSRCSSPGGPGRTTTTQPPASSTRPGRRAGDAEHERTVAAPSPASVRRARSRRTDGAAARRSCARSRSIWRSSVRVDVERHAGSRGHELDRPVVVGRAEAAGDEADRSASKPVRARRPRARPVRRRRS